ncbi:MAG: type IV conjugative transfer system lipoprotein TraV [Steroidobacteraceae bacterium]
MLAKRHILLIALPTLSGLLSACGTVGEKSFSCPGRPAGVHCMTTTEVYAATENSDVVAPTAPHPLGDKPPSRRTSHNSRGTEPQNATGSHRADGPGSGVVPVVTPAVDKPIPIRTPAKVMRAWIAPWEDAHGVLHGGGYQFVEIETRRWSLGESESANAPVRSFAIQKVDPPESVGKDSAASSTRASVSEHPKQSTGSTLPKSGASSWSTPNHGAQPPP